ncbi:hypothetical protein B296_00034457 [Ensete ventricosum]|uniref:Uncharacterized protein n=1 Tax=Ensete ventricosum TaxID=4639 RepID=A0A426ZC80_ENSVE|nr:hypothetical protein B296_00034457 [Ensete ventricosum]
MSFQLHKVCLFFSQSYVTMYALLNLSFIHGLEVEMNRTEPYTILHKTEHKLSI